MSAAGYHRKKQPDQVKAALLDQAAILAARCGVHALTIQGVAEAAGVTKGGLLHHFPGRESLVRALQTETLGLFEAAIAAHMEADPQPHGRYTRAYIRACLQDVGEACASPVLVAALWSDPDLRRDWQAWTQEQETRHAATDGDDALKMLRFTADGLWLARTNAVDVSPWLDRLLAATHQR